MITIVTPTYNRAYILSKAYQSLKKQTLLDFEWIIIDDGSTDETETIVKQWLKEEHNFSIIYEKQKNGGKHRAVNRAVSLANYDYLLILDSDDQLTENAVEKVHEWILDISGLEGFAGVAGLKADGNTTIGGSPQSYFIDATNLERKKYNLLGDKAEIYKTDVLKQYPFPEFENENFIRESAVWDRIAKDGLKIRWYNEVIYICEYKEDGLTKQTNENTYANNFLGFIYCSKLFLETHSFFPSLNKCGEFYYVSKLKGLKIRESASLLNINQIYFILGIGYFRIRQVMKTKLKKRTKGN